MPAIQSELDVNGEDFARNREAMLAAVAGFRELEQKVLDKAAEARPKFEKRGQLLPRERLALRRQLCVPRQHADDLAGQAHAVGGARRRRRFPPGIPRCRRPARAVRLRRAPRRWRSRRWRP